MPDKAQTYFQGRWLEGNPALMGPLTNAMWLSSIVFDGARAFEGAAPDLDLHCERVVRSARALGLGPSLTGGEILALAQEGIARFPKDAELYIRPMFWADEGWVAPDPDSTQFALTIHESPMPKESGYSACISTRRRPAPDTAPTSAKASCLYPQSGLALTEARQRGFDNAVMLDPLGNVAEFATSNIMIGKDGVVRTPAPNGTFLDGITRQRVIALLRADGVEVVEGRLTPEDVLNSDEVFSTGNFGKVLAFTRIENRDLQPGPLFARARRLYWDFAHGRIA